MNRKPIHFILFAILVLMLAACGASGEAVGMGPSGPPPTPTVTDTDTGTDPDAPADCDVVIDNAMTTVEHGWVGVIDALAYTYTVCVDGDAISYSLFLQRVDDYADEFVEKVLATYATVSRVFDPEEDCDPFSSETSDPLDVEASIEAADGQTGFELEWCIYAPDDEVTADDTADTDDEVTADDTADTDDEVTADDTADTEDTDDEVNPGPDVVILEEVPGEYSDFDSLQYVWADDMPTDRYLRNRAQKTADGGEYSVNEFVFQIRNGAEGDLVYDTVVIERVVCDDTLEKAIFVNDDGIFDITAVFDMTDMDVDYLGSLTANERAVQLSRGVSSDGEILAQSANSVYLGAVHSGDTLLIVCQDDPSKLVNAGGNMIMTADVNPHAVHFFTGEVVAPEQVTFVPYDYGWVDPD